MAKKGDAAREEVKQRIIEAFGNDFVAFVDKKIYVQVNEGGESLQFAITMTMPKNPIQAPAGVASEGGTIPTSNATPTELSGEDKQKVTELMKKLNLA